MAKSKNHPVDRRNFLKGAAVGAAALVATPGVPAAPPVAARRNATLAPISEEAAASSSRSDVLTVENPGSDFMVDVIKAIGFEYVCANPGNTFRGLHESLINYGGNKNPELITCCHEESAIGMGNGFAKIEGKPLLVMVHGTVGLQHASMAIYNAYCDRVPVFIILGNIGDATARFGTGDWVHSAQDPAAMIRDYVKWDDNPVSLGHFGESAARAYKIAMTPPMLPVALVADHELQEIPNLEGPGLIVPKITVTTPPAGDSGAVEELARLLVAAENPVIVVDRAARTPAGLTHLVELAEALQVPVVDYNGRMNFPSRHPLNLTERGSGLIREADVVVGLETWDFWGVVHSVEGQVHRTGRPITKPGAKLVTITANDLDMKNNYQDVQRYSPVDLAIAADAEATLPSLIEAINRQITGDRKRMYEARGAKLANASREALQQARDAATYGWDASPISTARLSAEVWAQIKNEDWSLVSDVTFLSRWPLRLWDFTKYYQYIGSAGAGGLGYQLPASTGAALANRKYGRLSVNLQTDGDLMFAPGALWTSAHHKIPLLSVMHNNRAYHQEVMKVQRMANRRNRGITDCTTGTKLEEPFIDFSKLAQSMGVYAEGPISDPKDLAPALQRAIAVVKRGEPALVDVLTQPR